MAIGGPSTPKYTKFIPVSTKTSSEFGGQRGLWDKNEDTERKAFTNWTRGLARPFAARPSFRLVDKDHGLRD